MLHARLAWPDKVRMVSKKQVHKVLGNLTGADKNQVLTRVADRTDSDLIIDGSITKLAGSFSIDAMVYDLKNKRYMTFFE
jgi:hypothetical protein